MATQRKIITVGFSLLIVWAVSYAQPARRLFDFEQRSPDEAGNNKSDRGLKPGEWASERGDTRPRPNLTPNKASLRSGERLGEGSAKASGWQPNGIIVCDTANCSLPKIVTDGNSGAIICWTESYRGADSVNHANDDIYAQRVDSGGNFVWQSQGVPVCSLSNTYANYPAMISDGYGGAIIAWEEYGRIADGYTHVYAQRLDNLGNRVWPENGVLVCSQPSGYVDVCSDGHGGAIIAYVDGRNSALTSDDIYAQRIDSAGNPVWAIDGVTVCIADSIQFWPYICSNNESGAIITWQDDYRNNGTTGRDVYAQMLDSLGSIKWTVNGEPLCIKPGIQRGRNPIVNIHNSGLFNWWAFSDTNLAYGQSLYYDGLKLWGLDGKNIKIRGDSYSDMRSGIIITSSITIQRVDSSGNIQWGPGVNIYPDSGGFYDACEDGNGGLIAICDKLRSSPFYSDQYVQRVDSNGLIKWNPTGVPVCTLQVASETYPQIAPDGLGGAICAWHGRYPGSQYSFYRDIIAQRVYADGTPGGVAGAPIENAKGKVQKIKLWPNPFTQSTNIEYQFSMAGKISLKIYNITGQLVKDIVEEYKHEGRYLTVWDGSNNQGKNMSSGLYFACFKANGKTETGKIIKLK